jgi:hypothetical protein
MELSRRSGRRFTFMVNIEAYKEWFGTARWCLEHIGSFSIERGASDQVAIKYAIDSIKKTNDVLVVFPEGEIYNLNESVQRFKTGAIHIGLEAMKEIYAEATDRTVSILPVAIKYHYPKDIGAILKKRIMKMEKQLAMRSNVIEVKDELYRIMNKLKDDTVQTSATAEIMEVDELAEHLQRAREVIVSEIEKKYNNPVKNAGDLLSRAQKMTAFLREQINKKKFFTKETQIQLEKDMQALKKTIQMAAWQPQYIELNPSEERLAETVIKLEKIVFNKKRPPPFDKREAFVRLLEPLDLSQLLAAYEKDPSNTASSIAEDLRAKIQQSILEMRGL